MAPRSLWWRTCLTLAGFHSISAVEPRLAVAESGQDAATPRQCIPHTGILRHKLGRIVKEKTLVFGKRRAVQHWCDSTAKESLEV